MICPQLFEGRCYKLDLNLTAPGKAIVRVLLEVFERGLESGSMISVELDVDLSQEFFTKG